MLGAPSSWRYSDYVMAMCLWMPPPRPLCYLCCTQGRKMVCTGANGALCGEQAKYASLNCKQFDMLPQADAESLSCSSGHCSESDKDYCCRVTSEESLLQLNAN